MRQADEIIHGFFGDRLDRYARAAGLMTRAVVFGLLITAVVQGTIAGIGYAVFRVEAPIALGVLTALASIVPVVGTFLVWGSAGLILVVTGHLWARPRPPRLGHPPRASGGQPYSAMLIGKVTQMPFLVIMFGVLGGVLPLGWWVCSSARSLSPSRSLYGASGFRSTLTRGAARANSGKSLRAMNVEFQAVERRAGLGEEDARLRLQRDGTNELPSTKPRSVFAIAWEVVRAADVPAAGRCRLLPDLWRVAESVVLLAFVVVVMGITLYQERKTERALDALQGPVEPARTRDPRWRAKHIPGREVVVDDLIVLEKAIA